MLTQDQLDDLRERVTHDKRVFAFKDKFGLWQVKVWWVHLGEGLYGWKHF